MRAQRVTLTDGLADILSEIRSSVGQEAVEDATPLWTPMEPQPGRGFQMPDGRIVSPQRAAYESLADELYYGGTPGGGKSDLALGLALTRHKNSIIYRLESKQFKGAGGLWERSRELIGLRGDSNSTDLSWRNLPGGRTLEMAGVRTDNDLLKWKGRPHDLIVFEETPEHAEQNFRFLKAWLRTSIQGQRVRIVCPGNPPMTPEGRWVIDYWAPWLDRKHPNPAQQGELRYFAAVGDGDVECKDGTPFVLPASSCRHQFDDFDVKCRRCGGEVIRPLSRTFIASYVEDNPYYMRTGYVKQLNALPQQLRQMLRNPNFDVQIEDDAWQLIPGAWVDAAMARWKPEDGEGLVPIRAGVDVSRGGKDEFVTSRTFGNPLKFIWLAPQAIHPAKAALDGEEGAALIVQDLGGDDIEVQIDIGGPGYSVRDFALKKFKLRVVDINGSEKTSYTDGRLKFVNKRASIHWQMRRLLDPQSTVKVALPPDPQLKLQLCATRWLLTSRGVQMEDKEDIKSRIGCSPDRGESCIYACVSAAEKKVVRRRGLVWGPTTRKALLSVVK